MEARDNDWRLVMRIRFKQRILQCTISGNFAGYPKYVSAIDDISYMLDIAHQQPPGRATDERLALLGTFRRSNSRSWKLYAGVASPFQQPQP